MNINNCTFPPEPTRDGILQYVILSYFRKFVEFGYYSSKLEKILGYLLNSRFSKQSSDMAQRVIGAVDLLDVVFDKFGRPFGHLVPKLGRRLCQISEQLLTL